MTLASYCYITYLITMLAETSQYLAECIYYVTTYSSHILQLVLFIFLVPAPFVSFSLVSQNMLQEIQNAT